MLRRARLGLCLVCRLPSVYPSVRNVQVCFSYRLEYFQNNFAAEWLRVYARADPNMSDLVQREHPKLAWNRSGVMSTKTCNISEMVQDRTNKGYYDGLIGNRIRALDWYLVVKSMTLG